VIAVSRFRCHRTCLVGSRGVRTVSADLLDRDALRQLPDAENVVFLVGLKFGTRSSRPLTWAGNTLGRPIVMERTPASRAGFPRPVALSTGNVYPLTPVVPRRFRLGRRPLTPVGEYANAAVARERISLVTSRTDTARGSRFLRLNYCGGPALTVCPRDIRKRAHGQDRRSASALFSSRGGCARPICRQIRRMITVASPAKCH